MYLDRISAQRLCAPTPRARPSTKLKVERNSSTASRAFVRSSRLGPAYRPPSRRGRGTNIRHRRRHTRRDVESTERCGTDAAGRGLGEWRGLLTNDHPATSTPMRCSRCSKCSCAAVTRIPRVCVGGGGTARCGRGQPLRGRRV